MPEYRRPLNCVIVDRNLLWCAVSTLRTISPRGLGEKDYFLTASIII